MNRPNFFKLAHEIFAATAYLEIHRDGEITTDCDYYFRKNDCRFVIDCQLTESEIEQLIKKVQPLASKLIEAENEMDSESFQEIRLRIEEICESHLSEEIETILED